MKKVQSQSTSNPASISQKAATAALNGPHDDVEEMRQAFKKRHDFVYERLTSMQNVRVLPSDGTFYSFPDVSAAIAKMSDVNNDVELASKLLSDAGVALVPGSAFGCEGCIRLSFATSMDILDDALTRLEKILSI